MPRTGVSVPRGNVHRGDRWSDDLELDFPSRRARTERRANRPPAAPVLALEDDPYNLDLDLHFDLGLTPERARGASRSELPRASVTGPAEPPRTSVAAPKPGVPSSTAPPRRTITIQGRPGDRYRPEPSARRHQLPPHHRAGFQPDRVAMWAVFLGLVLLLVAATSSHAAVLGVHALAGLAAR